MLSTHVRSAAAALALLGALAACEGSNGFGTGIQNPGDDEAGTYTAESITPQGSATSVALPGVVFQGNLTVSGETVPVRVEVLSGSLVLDADSAYRLTVRYRLVSTDGRFQAVERLTEEVGSYLLSLNGTAITFTPIGNGFLQGGTRSGATTVLAAVSNPVLAQTDVITFRR